MVNRGMEKNLNETHLYLQSRKKEQIQWEWEQKVMGTNCNRYNEREWEHIIKDTIPIPNESREREQKQWEWEQKGIGTHCNRCYEREW